MKHHTKARIRLSPRINCPAATALPHLEGYFKFLFMPQTAAGLEIIMKYECPCGYVYDEAVGDPDSGIAPGTKWEDIPDDWVCPICGLGKDAFTVV